MGISGLLQFIKDAGEPVNVKKYKGQTVAVDTYCWLHKGAFSCAMKLAKGEPTDQYVWYCMKFVDMLLNFSVKPILVFDGRNLPSKQEVEKSRRERRETNLKKGRQLLREGKVSEARDCFNRCVNITPAMAHKLIKAARARGVDCVVAPYEADAQLAHLNKCGLAQAVITEDSDLLAFGCKKVILKMDQQGNGLEIDQSNLGRCRSLGDVFTEEKFRYMCILSGCDYLASLYGIGLGKACKLLKLAKDPDVLKVIRKMGQYLKMNLVVPEEYVEGFVRANNTFLYQLVFDPVRRKVVPLNPYPEHIDPASLSYAGLHLGDDTGLQMALGNLDINTMEKIDDFSPDKPMTQPPKSRSHSWKVSPAMRSIWNATSLQPVGASSPRPVTAPNTPPSTRGQKRVISLDGLRLQPRQVKRPREDSGLSDQDVLQQYSSSRSVLKRSSSHQQPDKSPNRRPQPRNCFATQLQRRNQEVQEDGEVTCSRFFSGPVVNTDEAPQGDAAERVQPRDTSPSRDESSEGPSVPSVDTPSPSPSTTPSSPCPSSRGLQLFHWSADATAPDHSRTPKSTSGLAALQRFQYKKESRTSTDRHPVGRDDPPDSPPSQDSAYFSQSQPGVTSLHEDDLLPHEAPEMDSSKDSEPEQSPTRSQGAEKKPVPVTSKAVGLRKPRLSRQVPASKVRSLGPARASGLRRKSTPPSPNNENSPGVQATLSILWKNYSFKKETQKMTPCKKPMSPVEDNQQDC